MTKTRLQWQRAFDRSNPKHLEEAAGRLMKRGGWRKWLAVRMARRVKAAKEPVLVLHDLVFLWTLAIILKCSKCGTEFLSVRDMQPPPSVRACASPLCPACVEALGFNRASLQGLHMKPIPRPL